VLMHKLPKPEITKSRRVEVVGHADATWMDVDTWDVCHMCQWVPKKKVDAVGQDDVAWGDVDLPKCTTCHHHGG
jgi:hypothetical protein